MEAMGNRQIKAAELFLFDGRLGGAFLASKFPILEMLEENLSKQALAYSKNSKSFFWI